MYAGYLWPFGHAASLIKVTERKFESLDAKPHAACRAAAPALLHRRCASPCARTAARHHTFQGRNFPFTRIELLTRVTPDLSEPGEGDSALQPASALYAGLPGVRRMLFWPMVPPAGGASLPMCRFEIAATDIAGRSRDVLDAAAVRRQARRGQAIGDVSKSYNATPAFPRSGAPRLGGAIVTYAPPDPADKGDPKLADCERSRSGRRRRWATPAKPNGLSGNRRRRRRHQADPEAARAAELRRRGHLPRLLQDRTASTPTRTRARSFSSSHSEGADVRRRAAGGEERRARARSRRRR